MFYVYVLIDPRDGLPFYVGKGRNNRCYAHEREAHRGKAGAKCDRIRAISADGQRVDVRIIKWFKGQDAALRAEAALIDKIGLQALTNIAPGGFGGRWKQKPFRWTVENAKTILPRVKRCLIEMVTGDGHLYAAGVDITENIMELLRQLRDELGGEYLREALALKARSANQVLGTVS